MFCNSHKSQCQGCAVKEERQSVVLRRANILCREAAAAESRRVVIAVYEYRERTKTWGSKQRHGIIQLGRLASGSRIQNINMNQHSVKMFVSNLVAEAPCAGHDCWIMHDPSSIACIVYWTVSSNRYALYYPTSLTVLHPAL